MNPFSRIHVLCALFVLFLAGSLSAHVDGKTVEPGTYVFGIEYDGTICGYAEITVSNEEMDGLPYTLLKHEVVMKRAALGSEFTTKLDLTYHIDPKSGQFTYHDSHVDAGDVQLDSKVVVENGRATFTSTLDAEETVIELSEGVILENTLFFPHIVRDLAAEGMEKATYDFLEVREWDIQKTTCTKVGVETLELAGKTFDTLIVDRMSQATGVKVRVWIDIETGIVVRTKLSNGMISTLADPSVKKRIQLVNIDSTILTKTNVKIADIHGITYMKVKAVMEPSGLRITAEDLNVPGQSFVGTVKDNLVEGVFEIAHPHYDGTNAPGLPPRIDDDSLQAFIEPEEFIESDDPVLIRKAQMITAGSKDSWEAAVRLSQWVADNIAYEIPGGMTARKTYDLRKGECGAHSILLAAFCRSLGIPARVVWGCMYIPNMGGAFGQHAWSEIWMGEAGWIPVDSTAYEVDFADSGHIRVGILGSMTTAINTRHMEILDHRVGSGQVEDVDTAQSGKYEDYVGDYLAEGTLTIPALVRNGNLCVDIRGQILPMKDQDDKGRWYCQLTSRLYFTFTRDEKGAVDKMTIHEIIQMNRKSDPGEIPEGVPPEIVPCLGGYYFPQARAEFTVLWDDDRLTIHNPLEKKNVHFDPPDAEGWRLDEYGKHSITFEMDDEGKPIALLLNKASSCERQ
jgi:hypothetical protein